MAGRVTFRAEILFAMMTGQCTNGDRIIGSARQNGPGFSDASPGGRSEQRVAIQLTGLALVGCHSERRISLEMLDRHEAFLRGKPNVGVGDIVLEIDKGLGLAFVDLPQRFDLRRIFGRAWNIRFRNGTTEILCDRLRGSDAIGQRFSERQTSGGRTDRGQVRRG